jgi:hypothetical protein
MKADNAYLAALLDMDSYELFTILNFYVEYFDMSIEPEEDWGNELEHVFLQYHDAEKLGAFARKFCATAFQTTEPDVITNTLTTIIRGDGECEVCGGKGEPIEMLSKSYHYQKVLKECEYCNNQWEDILTLEHFE